MDPREMLVTGHCRGHVRFHSGIRGKDTVGASFADGGIPVPEDPRVATTQISYFRVQFQSEHLKIQELEII